MVKTSTLLNLIFILITVYPSFAQEAIVPLPYGNMDSWMVREVKESFVIGGKERELYEITDKRDTLKDNIPYKNTKSPWATSSVLAKVKGISKGSVSVFPEKRDTGYAARLETRVEHVKVLGILHIHVLASGTIFLGQMVEPITNTDNPQSKLISGVPFTKKPDYLQFDYKVISGGPQRKINGIRACGKKIGEKDNAEIDIILQNRWEDKKGRVHAKRIGTGWERMDKTVEQWQDKHRIKVHYGNISKKRYYRDYMKLRNGKNAQYTRNSKGNMVPIQEEGWGNPSDKVTHMILQFSSSNGGAYIGNPKSRLWIDNVGLVYKNNYHNTHKLETF